MNGKLIRSVNHGDYPPMSLFCTIVWLVYCSEAARPHDMPDVIKEWGSGKIDIQCLLKDDRSDEQTIHNTNIFWEKDDEDLVQSYNGRVSHWGANPNATKLRDDGSLSVKNDYSATGEYVCDYSRPDKSYIKTRTRVIVQEPPLRVLECNSTDANQSTPCRLTVPNGTESLGFTVIKAGLKAKLDPTLTVDHPRNIPFKEETKNTTRNEDNSTTISARYLANVIDITSSSDIRFILVSGQTIEEFVVVLNKAEERGGGGGQNVTPGKTAGIIVGVIMSLFVIAVIAFVVKRRWRRHSGERSTPDRTPTSL